MRWVISLLVAVLVGYSLSIVINASVSAATLVGFGIEVSLSDRLDMIAKEWVGLGTIYLPLIPHITCHLLLVAGPCTPQSGGDHSYRAGNVRGSWRTVANDILSKL